MIWTQDLWRHVLIFGEPDLMLFMPSPIAGVPIRLIRKNAPNSWTIRTGNRVSHNS